jgi:RimJ/RimL family protein N-acetyltransferase
MRQIITAKNGTKILLREPKISDAKQLMEMFNKTIVEPGIGISVKKKVTLREEKEWLKKTLSEIKKSAEIFLVFIANGKIVGDISIKRRAMNTKEAHMAIFGIVIAKEARNKGIAQKALPIAINFAKKRMKGLEIIELEVFETNKLAQHVYKKLGFKKVGIIPHKIKTKEGYHSSIVMLKYLKKLK